MAKSSNAYVDLLDEDKPLAGQKYVCVSFVSPDKILKQKDMFFFERFLSEFDFTKSMMKFQQFLNFISYKHNLKFDKVMEDYQDFIKTERENLIDTSVEDEYKNFLDANEEKLEKEFNEMNNFQTSTRGVKIRGVFPTQQEAELRCKLLREQDPNHDIYVGPVGMWMPWEPEAYRTGRVEYLENELNQLMHEKQKNESRAKEEFDARVREAKISAIEKNKELARKTGNKLTQNVDASGNLIDVANTNTIIRDLEDNLNGTGSDVTSADIQREIFNSDDINRTRPE